MLLVLGRVLAHQPQMRRRQLLLQAEVILVAVIFLAVFVVILVT